MATDNAQKIADLRSRLTEYRAIAAGTLPCPDVYTDPDVFGTYADRLEQEIKELEQAGEPMEECDTHAIPGCLSCSGVAPTHEEQRQRIAAELREGKTFGGFGYGVWYGYPNHKPDGHKRRWFTSDNGYVQGVSEEHAVSMVIRVFGANAQGRERGVAALPK